MVLKRVEYAVFESDAGALELAERGEDHEIDREIRLHFADGSVRSVSWCSKPVQYCVGVSDVSFFTSPPPLVVDGSAYPMWSPLIGARVDIECVDAEHQVVRVSTSSGAVFLASREGPRWYADVLHISDQPQRPDV